MKNLSRPNKECSLAQKTSSGNIIGHGSFKAKWVFPIAMPEKQFSWHSLSLNLYKNFGS
jgi:hypothetical protein